MKFDNSSTIIVDDDAPRARLLAAMLRRIGCAVRTVAAIEELSAAPPQGTVVLAADGTRSTVDLLAALRARRLFLPVIAYRAEPTARHIVAAVSAGAADYLVWPCDEATLTASITAVRGADLARRERSGQ